MAHIVQFFVHVLRINGFVCRASCSYDVVKIVCAVIELPKAVDCPAIVIELFVSDAFAILERVFDAPLIVLLVNVCEFIFGLASWTDDIISQADESEVQVLLQDIGMAFIVACNHIQNIIVECNPDNNAIHELSSLPSVLPHELMKISAAEFLHKAHNQSACLESYYSIMQIDVITDQHKELLCSYRSEPVLCSDIET